MYTSAHMVFALVKRLEGHGLSRARWLAKELVREDATWTPGDASSVASGIEEVALVASRAERRDLYALADFVRGLYNQKHDTLL